MVYPCDEVRPSSKLAQKFAVCSHFTSSKFIAGPQMIPRDQVDQKHLITALSKAPDPKTSRFRKIITIVVFSFCAVFVWEWLNLGIVAPQNSPKSQKFSSLPLWDTNFSDISPLSTSYALWSRHPDKANWSDIVDTCNAILMNSTTDPAIEIGKNWAIPHGHTDRSISDLLSNCAEFRKSIPFASRPASRAEAEFPLAYVILGARNAAQFVRFFRMIYQPQNAYCITYDDKGADDFKTAVRRLAGCFSDENVFLIPKPERIEYGDHAILRTVMGCVKMLLDRSITHPWNYVQIVSWNDFPLRTNAEMVEIFKILNGSQDCLIEVPTHGFYIYDRGTYNVRSAPVVPDGLTMYKGSFATSMTKEFVQFLFTNPTAIRLFHWLKGGHCAEEHYWQTLIHNTHLNAPGSFPGACYHYYATLGKRIKPFISRFQIWTNEPWYGMEAVCNGKWTSYSCVYGVADVPKLIARPELIAHKVYEEVQPATLFCLEQWFWNRSSGGLQFFNGDYYAELPSVRYQNMEDKNQFIC